jgi:3-hydroxybutyryl-CoA dehydratase
MTTSLEVTDETPPRALSIGDIAVGDTVVQRVVFDAQKHLAFACLAWDRGRIHGDDTFARQRGFDAPIVQGLAVASRFSRLLGMYLPGENAILQKIQFKYHRPVYADHELLYGCKVQQLMRPLRAVVLALSVSVDGIDCVTGECQCLIL